MTKQTRTTSQVSFAAGRGVSSCGRAGCGFGGAGIGGAASADGFFGAGEARLGTRLPITIRLPRSGALRRKSEKRHLPLHVRRPEPHRHFRLQTDDGRHGRQDDRRENPRPRRPQERRPDRRAALEVSAVRPMWQMGQHLFPHLGECVDDIAFLHSMTAESPIHGSAMLMMNSGKLQSGSPALGSWVNYGLGSANENMPGYVVMFDHTGGPISGAKNWSSGYMPATYAGTVIRPEGSPINDLSLPAGHDAADAARHSRFAVASSMRTHHAARPDQADLAARIASYELAFRMQQHAPEAVDLSQETQATRELYGLDDESNAQFRHALSARATAGRTRRAVHPGLFRRFAQRRQLGRPRRPRGQPQQTCRQQPTNRSRLCLKISSSAGYLKKRWSCGAESSAASRPPSMTREPAEITTRMGFTMWMAGGGIKGGVSVGATDEIGSAAVDEPMHVKRLHATVLQQMGLDPNRLSLFLPRPRSKTCRGRTCRTNSPNHRLIPIRIHQNTSNLAREFARRADRMTNNGRHFRLDGHVALVTGSTRGLGKEMALRSLRPAPRTAMNYRNDHENALRSFADLQQISTDSHLVQGDITDAESIERMCRDVRTRRWDRSIFLSSTPPAANRSCRSKNTTGIFSKRCSTSS